MCTHMHEFSFKVTLRVNVHTAELGLFVGERIYHHACVKMCTAKSQGVFSYSPSQDKASPLV